MRPVITHDIPSPNFDGTEMMGPDDCQPFYGEIWEVQVDHAEPRAS